MVDVCVCVDMSAPELSGFFPVAHQSFSLNKATECVCEATGPALRVKNVFKSVI